MDIRKEDIPDLFQIRDYKNKTYLKIGTAKEIQINFPLILDEDLTKISAMLLDGSLDKNLSNFMFSQKKDFGKIKEFYEIMRNKFNITPRLYKLKHKTWMVVTSSKTLSSFLYFCLDINKCDENTKIPDWIYKSSQEIKREYLRYAFAMEGSVVDPRIGVISVRFHNCDGKYIKELKKFILDNFNINFTVFRYFIKDYGYKYFLEILSIEEIRKFGKIGFALESHQKRLETILNNIKSKAWEITLKNLVKIEYKYFRIKDVNKLFPYLCKRAIHHRLSDLIKMSYLSINNNGYYLTSKWYQKGDLLSNVKDTKLRTNPRENEKLIFELIKRKGLIWRNEISRTLNIHAVTVREVLKRLIKKNKIELSHIDTHQKKYYKKYSGSSPRF